MSDIYQTGTSVSADSGSTKGDNRLEKGQPVTVFMGEEMHGPVAEFYIASRRRDMKWILPEVKDSQAFYVLEAARDVSRVLKPTFAPIGGWRALSKRKQKRMIITAFQRLFAPQRQASAYPPAGSTAGR